MRMKNDIRMESQALWCECRDGSCLYLTFSLFGRPGIFCALLFSFKYYIVIVNLEFWLFQGTLKFCTQREIFPTASSALGIKEVCAGESGGNRNLKTSVKCTLYISFHPQLQILNICNVLPSERRFPYRWMWWKSVNPKKATPLGSRSKTCFGS